MADEIRTLVDVIRYRPGIYIGGQDSRALQTMLEAMQSLAFSEASYGRLIASQVVLLDDNQIEIAITLSSGNLEEMTRTPPQILSDITRRVASTRYFIEDWLDNIVVAIALSHKFTLEIWQGTEQWQMSFEQGKITLQPNLKTQTSLLGYSIDLSLKPDLTIFNTDSRIDFNKFSRWLEVRAESYPEARFSVWDNRSDD